MNKQKRIGFTIVELLIVIVVIAILAALSVVAYNGVQARANDSRIVSNANRIEKAIKMYSADKGSFPVGLGWYATNPPGNVCTTSSGGWAAIGTYAHTCTLDDLLTSEGLLPVMFIRDSPPNKFMSATNGRLTFMWYRCDNLAPNYFVLYWYLENPSSQDISNFNSVNSQCGLSSFARTNYGMQAARLMQL
jgi:prepilin-type N-terminal cleavage/methylation domain-containing protein